MRRSVYYFEFESKYYPGEGIGYTTVASETRDEAIYLVESKIEAALERKGYYNDPGNITKVRCLD